MVIDSIPEDDQLDDYLTKEQDELDEHDIIVDVLYAWRNWSRIVPPNPVLLAKE